MFNQNCGQQPQKTNTLIGSDVPWLIYPLTLTLKNRDVKAVFSYGVRGYADIMIGGAHKTTLNVLHVDFVESEC
jgi:hypothetical protein